MCALSFSLALSFLNSEFQSVFLYFTLCFILRDAKTGNCSRRRRSSTRRSTSATTKTTKIQIIKEWKCCWLLLFSSVFLSCVYLGVSLSSRESQTRRDEKSLSLFVFDIVVVVVHINISSRIIDQQKNNNNSKCKPKMFIANER